MVTEIIWQDSFNTGIPEVDVQHRRLVEIINTLAEAIQAEADKAHLLKILDDLAAYTQYHFKTEEAFMRDIDYVDFEAHHMEHQSFVEQIQIFDLDIVLATEGLTWDIFHFLRSWLCAHILGVDQRFAAIWHSTTN